jgi:hypothetical protein
VGRGRQERKIQRESLRIPRACLSPSGEMGAVVVGGRVNIRNMEVAPKCAKTFSEAKTRCLMRLSISVKRSSDKRPVFLKFASQSHHKYKKIFFFFR